MPLFAQFDVTAAHLGFWSLVPALLAVILAFITREAAFSLLVACMSGVMIQGLVVGGRFVDGEFVEGAPWWDLAGLLQRAMGNSGFVWILLVELCIGILVAFFLRSASTQEFSRVMGRRLKTRRHVQLFGWGLGMCIFFSDYFSPLLTGPVLRYLTDKVKVSREKLAYICDSTSAPICVLVPFSAWSVYIAGLLAQQEAVADETAAINIFISSIGYNFYAILTVAMVGLLAGGLIPDFGPMRRAEQRAMNEGKVLADGAVPMMAAELCGIEPAKEIEKPRLVVNLAIPLLIVVVIAVGTCFFADTPRILEAFMLAVAYLGVALWLQKVPMRELVKTAVEGIKGVSPAVILLGLAYSINTVSLELGTASYVIEMAEGWLTPALLPLLAFAISAFISFSTGTSWGTYAIVIPIAVPLATAFSGGAIDHSVLATVAAIAGGGVFGDHCSPLSDTTILSSFGAASDHIDHVKTQLPYACTTAAAALALYLVLGALL